MIAGARDLMIAGVRNPKEKVIRKNFLKCL